MMKRIDKIKNMTVEEMAREIIRLNFTDEYCDNIANKELRENLLGNEITSTKMGVIR